MTINFRGKNTQVRISVKCYKLIKLNMNSLIVGKEFSLLHSYLDSFANIK